jgi:CheY-like chemotaxis protein
VFVLHVDGGEPESLAEALPMLNLSEQPFSLPHPLSLSQAVPVKSENPLEGLRILLVDDAADNRFLITRYLQLSGAKVESAENGRRAIEKLHDSNFDLVLMDIEMPEMNGLETVSFLRAEQYEGPVIALTGRAMPDEIEECRRAGFDSHLIKPVDRRKLVASIFEATREVALLKV